MKQFTFYVLFCLMFTRLQAQTRLHFTIGYNNAKINNSNILGKKSATAEFGFQLSKRVNKFRWSWALGYQEMKFKDNTCYEAGYNKWNYAHYNLNMSFFRMDEQVLYFPVPRIGLGVGLFQNFGKVLEADIPKSESTTGVAYVADEDITQKILYTQTSGLAEIDPSHKRAHRLELYGMSVNLRVMLHEYIELYGRYDYTFTNLYKPSSTLEKSHIGAYSIGIGIKLGASNKISRF